MTQATLTISIDGAKEVKARMRKVCDLIEANPIEQGLMQRIFNAIDERKACKIVTVGTPKAKARFRVQHTKQFAKLLRMAEKRAQKSIDFLT